MALLLQDGPLLLALHRLVGQGDDVHPRNLRRVENLAKRPDEGAVHADQLFGRDPVGLVEDDPELLARTRESGYAPSEFLRDVWLVDVEENEDNRRLLHEPGHHLLEVVPAIRSARQHARRIHERGGLQERVRKLRARQPGEEVVAEAGERAVGQPAVAHDGIPRGYLRLPPVADHGELVRGWLRPNVHALVVLPQQVTHEGRLAGGVVAHQQHHGARGEVRRR
mmetsp:Transcript_91736/g.239148  ORF Transcript_91736/g.239148 Transcript_91736/m.239148 type:complete len:224 (+) Transcript_91736:496-1167(+)